MSDADKDAEIASLKAQNATLQARVKELETGTARLSVRLSGALLLALPSAARSAPWPAGDGLPAPQGGAPCSMVPSSPSYALTNRLPAAEMGAAMLARPAEAEAPATSGSGESLELLQGMLMAQSQSIAKMEKKLDERTSNLESMAMQAAMNGAKQTSQTCEPALCARNRLATAADARLPRSRGDLSVGGDVHDQRDHDGQVRAEHGDQAGGDDERGSSDDASRGRN